MGIETLSNGRGGGGDETPTASSGNRVKFLISHGGRILPRPGDGQLKYIGGETRVLAVSADIKYSEMMKKISGIVEGEMVLKYPVIPDDLEALVSVRSDEDLKYMLDEYMRHENEENWKLRAFLLPSSLVKLENQTASTDPNVNEQRYIDAINGIVRPPSLISRSNSRRSHLSDSNPSSPDAKTNDSGSLLEQVLMNACHDGRIDMHRVQSSPSTLYSLNNAVSASNSNVPNPNHHFYQQHYHYNQQPQQHYPTGYQSPRQPPDPRDRMPPLLTMGPHDFARTGMGQQLPPNHFYQTGRPITGDSFREEWLPVSGNGRPDSAPMTPHHMWD